jgi:hypothetical protein
VKSSSTKRRTAAYIFHLGKVGLASYIGLLVVLAGHQLWKTNTVEPYEFGVLLISTGAILAFIGIFVFSSNALWQSQLRRFVAPHSRTAPARDIWAHYLLAVSIASLFAAITGISLVWKLTSNGIRQSVPGTVPFVVSLRAGLRGLEPYATEWRSDAYLVSASLYISDESHAKIWALYRSSRSSQSLYIRLLPDGTVKTSELPTRSSSSFEQAIEDTDWSIDSQDALKVFGAVDGVSSCLMSISSRSDRNSRLELERRDVAGKSSVVWSLLLYDCLAAEDTRSLRLNASTGELLETP